MPEVIADPQEENKDDVEGSDLSLDYTEILNHRHKELLKGNLSQRSICERGFSERNKNEKWRGLQDF